MTLCLFTFCWSAFSGDQGSFFMNDDDSQKATTLAKQSEETKEFSSGGFKLSGIFFIDEANWTIWLNGKAYSAIGQQGDFSIDEVSENEVTITNSDGNTIKLSVSCR